RSACGDGAELGDRDLPGREDLEEEGLELVVGPVDLVDEQDDRRVPQRLEDRAGQEEPLVEELALDLVQVRTAPLAGGRLDGAQVQDLAGEVPVVERLGGIDALVALQPDERQVEGLGQRLRERRLTGAGLTLHEERTGQSQAEPGDRRQLRAGEVAGGSECCLQLGSRRIRLTGIHGPTLPCLPRRSARAGPREGWTSPGAVPPSPS